MAKLARPLIRIHNSQTNEIIDREMNDAEFADFTARNEALEIEQIAAKAKATAKAALINKLGITAEEAALLLS